MDKEIVEFSRERAEEIANKLRFRYEQNTVIVVVQDIDTKDVLMVGHMNREAFIKTLTTGYLHLWSISHSKIWLKGETSGNYQVVVDIKVDCDEDAIVVLVRPLGPICHTGNKTCFYRNIRNIAEEP
ncbi:MAG: phosphoribosyl-AMP cyclohydrolase [Ignisphaera sp.]|uniref:phosphoribosyl-AMP cyclohydrolase n=1 Tax=Ignisphaera aggregans TaxID=334771 RepID=A0A7J3MWA0_9CREN